MRWLSEAVPRPVVAGTTGATAVIAVRELGATATQVVLAEGPMIGITRQAAQPLSPERAAGPWEVGSTHMRDVGRRWPQVGTRIHHSIGVWPVMSERPQLCLELDAARKARGVAEEVAPVAVEAYGEDTLDRYRWVWWRIEVLAPELFWRDDSEPGRGRDAGVQERCKNPGRGSMV